MFVLCKLYKHIKKHFVLQKFTSIVKHWVVSGMQDIFTNLNVTELEPTTS